eukprot:tig00000443_g767.t1
MEEDLDENGEICFNYCRLLRNISLECRKGDCFQHIMLNPAKNEITLYAVACPSARFRLSNIRVAAIEALPPPVRRIEHVFYLNHPSAQLKSDNMATVRNANEIDPAKLAFEIDATGRIKAKYDGLQGLMMYAPPMVTINPCINTEQGKAWSDEKKAFRRRRPDEPRADEFLKLLEALDAKFCEFVQQNQAKLKVSPGRSLSKDQISVLQTPSVRIKVDKESGQAFYKYLNMRIRTQTMAGKRKTIPVVDMSNYLITERATIGTGDLLAFKPYDNEADFEPYLNPESMYAAPMQ